MKEKTLHLCFKGGRDYVHGTDVYESALSALRAEWPDANGRLKFSFHRVTHRQCGILLTDQPDLTARPANAVAEISVTDTGSSFAGWVVEKEKSIDCRVPYDEDRIVAHCAILPGSIVISDPPENTAVEIAIAMTKALHYADIPPEFGRWMFTRLDLSRPFVPTDRKEMKIVHKSRLGWKISKSEVFVGTTKLGEIYFSVVQP